MTDSKYKIVLVKRTLDTVSRILLSKRTLHQEENVTRFQFYAYKMPR